MKVSIIVAAAENDIIGKDNQMPWRLSDDLKRFKRLTIGHPVIMGRKTYESLGKPLPGRQNIVISRNKDLALDGVTIVNSIEDALTAVSGAEEVFIIGGDNIYKQFWGIADSLYLTRVHTSIEGDTSIPSVLPHVWAEMEREYHEADLKNEHNFSFITYTKVLG